MEHQFAKFGIDTPLFSLAGRNCYARLVDVYDGDTVTVVMQTFGIFYKFTLRLHGIDTCEIKSKNTTARNLAFQARLRTLELLCANKVNVEALHSCAETDKHFIRDVLKDNIVVIWVECMEFDKYGRILANVFPTPGCESVSDVLLKENLAYAYNGQGKISEDEQIAVLRNV